MMKRILLSVSLLMLGCLNSLGQPITSATVRQGQLQGFEKGGLGYFYAIPYAQAPVGELRFHEPVPMAPWEGVRKATKRGGVAPQLTLGDNPRMVRSSTEDCLYVNVITPAKTPDEALPVLVWIHGGGFVDGDANNPQGDQFARRGVVYVTISYRTGPLGFLALPELSAESPHGVSGNYGLLDQVEALRWIHDNIAAFGGDPEKVTIMGESAGGLSVSVLCASPLTKGLFRGAICQSGGFFTIPSEERIQNITMSTLAGAEHRGERFLRDMGVSSVQELRLLPPEAWLERPGLDRDFWPCMDGYLIDGDPYERYQRGDYNDVDVILGTNSDEGSLFARPQSVEEYKAQLQDCFGIRYGKKLFKALPARDTLEAFLQSRKLAGLLTFGWPTFTWANLQRKTGNGNVYIYYFDEFEPGILPDIGIERFGAAHGSEALYAFGKTLENSRASDSAKKVSEAMISYWVNFTRNGDPNGEGLAAWPEYENGKRTVLLFRDGTDVIGLPERKVLKILDAYFRDRRRSL